MNGHRGRKNRQKSLPRMVVVALILIIGMVAPACGGDDSVNTGLDDARKNPITTVTTAPPTTAPRLSAMDNMRSLVSTTVNYQDGSSIALDVNTGEVRKFGDDPSFESGFLSCRVDQQRDGYLPISYSIANTTPGFGIPQVYLQMTFRPIEPYVDLYQFWDHHYGCDEPETNQWTPNRTGYLDVTLQLPEGGRWEGQAALILVGYFGPNHPNGPGTPSDWDPQFSIQGTNVFNVEVGMG